MLRSMWQLPSQLPLDPRLHSPCALTCWNSRIKL